MEVATWEEQFHTDPQVGGTMATSRIQILELSVTISLFEVTSDRQKCVTGGRQFDDHNDPERLEALLKYYEERVYNMKIDIYGDDGQRLIFTPVDQDYAPLGVYAVFYLR